MNEISPHYRKSILVLKTNLLLLLLSTALNSSADVFITSSHGNWEDNSVWQGNASPGLTTNDTIRILHPILISNNLLFDNNAYLFIDSDGGICGHQNVSFRNNSKMVSRGVFEIDELQLVSSWATIIGGYATITEHAQITGSGAGFQILGGSLSVGPWFDCRRPTYNFLSINDNSLQDSRNRKLYPNPTSRFLHIDFEKIVSKVMVEIRNAQGSVVYENNFQITKDLHLDLQHLSPGVYFVFLRTEAEIDCYRFVKQQN